MSQAKQIYDFLKGCNGFFFASCDGDKPRVRAFGFTMVFEDKIYFGMGTHKESYKQVVANPNVEICAMHPERGVIRIKGIAHFDMRPEVQEAMFVEMPNLKKLYNDETKMVQATFYLSDIDAEINCNNQFSKIEG